MVSSMIPEALPLPQDVAAGVFVLTESQILWYARFTRTEAGDDR